MFILTIEDMFATLHEVLDTMCYFCAHHKIVSFSLWNHCIFKKGIAFLMDVYFMWIFYLHVSIIKVFEIITCVLCVHIICDLILNHKLWYAKCLSSKLYWHKYLWVDNDYYNMGLT
jgi:hypothetical protein